MQKLTGLRAYAHQPLVRRRLLIGKELAMKKADGTNVELIPMLSLNERWILNGTPGELGECFAPFECPLSLHLEAALL